MLVNFFPHEWFLRRYFRFFYGLVTFCSDTNFAFCCLGMFFFEVVFIFLIDLDVCIVIKYRYYLFADIFLALCLFIQLSV